MTETDRTSPTPSGYRMLSDPQLETIHQASLEILRRTGVRVFDPEARDLLGEAGCHLSDGDLVKFPPGLVEEAIRSAPSRIVLCTRTGEPRVRLEAHRSYFGTGSDLPNTRDLETGERRPSVLEDVERAARLADALPNLDFCMSMAQASDVPQATSDRRAFLAMLENTIKPIVFTAWDQQGLADIVTMAETVAGSAQQLALDPFLLAYLEPSSPLQHPAEVMQKVLYMADKGLPFVYAPGPIDGASAPMTTAGGLAMANAEVLSGLTLAQVRRPGTPVLFGSGSGPLDMKTSVATYFSPEFIRHCVAMSELGHFLYRLPTWGFSGCSDSKLADAQAGVESAIWVLATMLSGANLVHDVGYIESGLTCSLEMMVIGDEIIDCVRRLLAPLDMSSDALALELIDDVGPGGEFLSTSHTRRHFKNCWYPRIFDRRTHESWKAAGGPNATETAREVARQILASHVPEPLADDVRTTLHEITEQAEQRAR